VKLVSLTISYTSVTDFASDLTAQSQKEFFGTVLTFIISCRKGPFKGFTTGYVLKEKHSITAQSDRLIIDVKLKAINTAFG
jgi:hypothetical protein